MTFTKSGFHITAFWMVGAFTMNGKWYGASWIVRGWAEGRQVVMTDEQFEVTFHNREAA